MKRHWLIFLTKTHPTTSMQSKKEGFKDFIQTLYGQIKPIPYLCRLKTFATI